MAPKTTDFLSTLPILPIKLPNSLQELSPKQAKLCLHIAKNIQEHYELSLSQEKILIGFSGGTDSLALLLILRILAKTHNFHFVAAHLHHSLREVATAEATWCEQLCATFAIPFYTETFDVPALMQEKNMGMEETARYARYTFYERAAKIHQCSWVALGHHANDLAEDVLMRLVRGTGWPALAGMQGICHKRKLFRPLLHVTKAQLADFLAELTIQPLEDYSNYDPAFLRNRVRMHILPLFEKENPRFLEHISELWHMGQLDGQYFAEKTQELVNNEREYSKNKDEALRNNNKMLHKQNKPLQNKPLQTPNYLSTQGKVLHKKNEPAHTVQESQKTLLHTTLLTPLRTQKKVVRLRFFKHILEQLGGQAHTATLFALDEAVCGNQFPKTIQFSHKIRVMVIKRALFWQKEIS